MLYVFYSLAIGLAAHADQCAQNKLLKNASQMQSVYSRKQAGAYRAVCKHDGSQWGRAVDCSGDLGEPILAEAGGTVVYVGNGSGGKNRCDTGYGKVVVVDEGPHVVLYAHLSDVSVREGQTVGINSMLGRMGNTGNVVRRAVHLHLEYIKKCDASDSAPGILCKVMDCKKRRGKGKRK